MGTNVAENNTFFNKLHNWKFGIDLMWYRKMKFVFIAGLLPWSVLQAEISKTGYKKSYCPLCLLFLLWHLEHWARLSDTVKYVGLLDYWAIDFLTPSTTGQNRLDSRRTALIWQCCMWPLWDLGSESYSMPYAKLLIQAHRSCVRWTVPKRPKGRVDKCYLSKYTCTTNVLVTRYHDKQYSFGIIL